MTAGLLAIADHADRVLSNKMDPKHMSLLSIFVPKCVLNINLNACQHYMRYFLILNKKLNIAFPKKRKFWVIVFFCIAQYADKPNVNLIKCEELHFLYLII